MDSGTSRMNVLTWVEICVFIGTLFSPLIAFIILRKEDDEET